MKIIVTGACGFIGSWIAKALNKAGHDLLLFDDLSGGSTDNIKDCPELLLRFHEVDISDYKKLNGVFKFSRYGFKPDVLVHCAANAREGASHYQPYSVTKKNALAFASILSMSIQLGLGKCVLFSSMAAYGNQQPPFKENYDLRPEDIYGFNKLYMESMMRILAGIHGFKWTIVRPHNVFGAFQAFDKFRNVFAIWMNRIMRNEGIQVYGDGIQRRQFSYIEDSLPCYLKIILEDYHHQIFNIGGLKDISLNEAAVLCNNVMREESNGAYKPQEIQNVNERKLEVKHAYCDNSMAVRFLGYEDKIGLDEGLRKMARWAWNRGKQEWSDEKMEIPHKSMPEFWK